MVTINISNEKDISIVQIHELNNIAELASISVHPVRKENGNIIFYAGDIDYDEFMDSINLSRYTCVGAIVVDQSYNIDTVTEDIIPEYPIHFDHEEKMYKVGTIEKHADMTDEEWEEYSYYILAPKAKVFYYLDD